MNEPERSGTDEAHEAHNEATSKRARMRELGRRGGKRSGEVRKARVSQNSGPDGTPTSVSKGSLGGGGLAENDPVDPIKVLEEIADDRTVKAYARTNAAKALAALRGSPEQQGQDWQISVQVRPDFTPPSPIDVLRVWYAAGALEDEDLKELVGT